MNVSDSYMEAQGIAEQVTRVIKGKGNKAGVDVKRRWIGISQFHPDYNLPHTPYQETYDAIRSR